MDKIFEIVDKFRYLSSGMSEAAKHEVVEILDELSEALENSDYPIEETALADSIISHLADNLRY